MSNRKNTNRAIVRCKAMRHMRPNPYGILLSGVCVKLDDCDLRIYGDFTKNVPSIEQDMFTVHQSPIPSHGYRALILYTNNQI